MKNEENILLYIDALLDDDESRWPNGHCFCSRSINAGPFQGGDAEDVFIIHNLVQGYLSRLSLPCIGL